MLRKLGCLKWGVLCKKSYDSILLRCTDASEANKIMNELREGQCRPPMSGFMLARWHMDTIGCVESDCFKHVQKCHLCQIYADRINQPPAPLDSMTSPSSFLMWGIDAIDMIHPNASNEHWFILVAIDYFTKWVEAASFENLTKVQVARLSNRILSVYMFCLNPL